MSEITQDNINILNLYRHIYYTRDYADRAAEFTKEDEKQLERIYNEWRGTTNHILDCDECVNEAFDRMMKQMIDQEKRSGTRVCGHIPAAMCFPCTDDPEFENYKHEHSKI